MKTRQQWIAMLAKLVAPMEATTASKAMADMLPMLTDYPDGAFTIASLDYVATQCKRGVPTYAELREHIGAWWKKHRPSPHAIAADQEHTIRQRNIEREVAASWADITAEQVRAKIRTVRDAGSQSAVLGHFLGSAIAKHARQHLGLLPPEWLNVPNEPAEVIALRKPREP